MEPSLASDDPAPAAASQSQPPLEKTAATAPKVLSKERQEAILKSICASIGSGTTRRYKARRQQQQQQQQQPNIVVRSGSGSGKAAAASNKGSEHALTRLENVSISVRKESAIVRVREEAIAAKLAVALDEGGGSGEGKRKRKASSSKKKRGDDDAAEKGDEEQQQQQQQKRKRIGPAERRMKTRAHTMGMHYLPYRAALGRGVSRISSRTVFPNAPVRRLLTSVVARHMGIYEGEFPDKRSRASRYLRISPEAVNIMHERAVAVLEKVIPLAEDNAANAGRATVTGNDMMRAYVALKLKGHTAPLIIPSTVGFEPVVVKNARAKLNSLKDNKKKLVPPSQMSAAARSDERVTVAALSNTVSWHINDHGDYASDDWMD